MDEVPAFQPVEVVDQKRISQGQEKPKTTPEVLGTLYYNLPRQIEEAKRILNTGRVNEARKILKGLLEQGKTALENSETPFKYLPQAIKGILLSLAEITELLDYHDQSISFLEEIFKSEDEILKSEIKNQFPITKFKFDESNKSLENLIKACKSHVGEFYSRKANYYEEILKGRKSGGPVTGWIEPQEAKSLLQVLPEPLEDESFQRKYNLFLSSASKFKDRTRTSRSTTSYNRSQELEKLIQDGEQILDSIKDSDFPLSERVSLLTFLASLYLNNRQDIASLATFKAADQAIIAAVNKSRFITGASLDPELLKTQKDIWEDLAFLLKELAKVIKSPKAKADLLKNAQLYQDQLKKEK